MKLPSDDEIKDLASRFARGAEPPAGLANDTLKRMGLARRQRQDWKWLWLASAMAAAAFALMIMVPGSDPAPKSSPVLASAVPQKAPVIRQPETPRPVAAAPAVTSVPTSAAVPEAAIPPVMSAQVKPATPQTNAPAMAPAPMKDFLDSRAVSAGSLAASGAGPAPSSGQSAAPSQARAAAISLSSSASVNRPASYQFKLKGNEIGPGHSSHLEIDLVLDRPGHCEIVLFSSNGERFCELMRADRPAGPWTVIWTGQAQDGSAAPSGVYTLVIQVPGHFEKSHVVVIR